MTYEIKGQVKDTATDSGAAGVRVEAWDKDLIYDDFLGNAETNANGEFVITFDEYFFRELFIDTWPDIYFKLFFDGEEIANTKDDVLWNVHSQNIHVDLKVKLPPKKKKWTERDIYLKIECIEDVSQEKLFCFTTIPF